jgi:hypothetical protein
MLAQVQSGSHQHSRRPRLGRSLATLRPSSLLAWVLVKKWLPEEDAYADKKHVALQSQPDQWDQWGLVTASAMASIRQGFGTKVMSAGTSFGLT